MSMRTDVPLRVRDVSDAFSATAAAYGEQPALVQGDSSVTYRELQQRVAAVASGLGPRPGVVGCLTSHSASAVVNLLGVLSAEGTYCPVDPGFPAARRQAMGTAAGCRTWLDATGGSDFSMAAHEREVAGSRDAACPPAYVLFTSGSTGAPKPVVTPRSAISVAVRSVGELFRLDPSDRVLQFASLSWDTCFEEILPTLTTGAALVLDHDAHSGSFPRILRMLARQRVTVLNLPTAFWHELVRYLVEDHATLPRCLRLVVIGGEAVSPSRLSEWRDLDTAAIRLVNTYGCTETTLITHAIDLHGPRASPRESVEGGTGRVPIGWALPHVLERVTDAGELLIGGPALASGYLGLPAATEARFPAGTGPDATPHFRTGDRVSRAPDGALVHEGRLDHEVKVRGIRVDPAEVEAQIATHPLVRAVAVAGVTRAERTTLVAYVVPSAEADAATLHLSVSEFLRARVPGHLVPSRVTVVTALAYTASGKIDRAESHRRHTAVGRTEETPGER